MPVVQVTTIVFGGACVHTVKKHTATDLLVRSERSLLLNLLPGIEAGIRNKWTPSTSQSPGPSLRTPSNGKPEVHYAARLHASWVLAEVLLCRLLVTGREAATAARQYALHMT